MMVFLISERRTIMYDRYFFDMYAYFCAVGALYVFACF